MLTVTAGALDRLSTKLESKKAEEDEAFRMTPRTGGWKLHLDRARPTDKEIKHDGRSVLLLDEAASRAMKDRTLDVRATHAGPRLSLRRIPDSEA
jgi:hypothetical protein